MIVKFFRRGAGKADSATDYLLSLSKAPLRYLTGGRNAKGVKRATAPVVVRGDPDLTRRLINQLQGKKWKYASGVLSFKEIITPQDEQCIIDRFEAAAFGGLRPGQYDCLWVRHCDHQRSELHFLTPRVELYSGKALNVRPPGKRTEELFHTFRTLVNHDFHLASPDKSGGRLTPEDVQALRQKLDRLVAARAKYNRERFPTPSSTLEKVTDFTFHERARSPRRSLATSGAQSPAARAGERCAFEIVGVAGRRLSEASRQLEHASDRLSRAACTLPGRLAQVTARCQRLAASRSLFARYGIPERQPSVDRSREIDRDEMERDLGDGL